MVVRPGNVDTYADMMQGIPELFPDYSGGHDAMAGNPSPESQAALQQSLGHISAESGQAVQLEGLEYGRRGGRPMATQTPALGKGPKTE
jgi:hypothetical protein